MIDQILKPIQDYFYQQPITEPMPVQPEEEIQTQYSLWVTGGIAAAAIMATIALKFFYKSTPTEKMFKACYDENINVVRKLLTEGFNPNIRNSDGKSPLDIAIEQDLSKVTLILLIEKTDLNTSNNLGEYPLHFAAKKGNLDVIDFLVGKDAKINVTTKTGKTPLYYAVENNKPAAVEALLLHKADVNIEAEETSLLEVALKEGFKDIVLLLIQNIDVNKANSMGETALHFAVKYEDPEILAAIKKKGANIDATTASKKTPLYYAVENRNVFAVRTLLDPILGFNANPNIGTDKGFTPLHIACKDYATCQDPIERAKSETIIQLLLSAKAEEGALAGVGTNKRTPLEYANSDPEVKRLLFPKTLNIY
jgi:ankyrin repeat protein